MSEHPVLQRLREWLAGQESVRLAMVYGSFADGTQTDASDLDLALAGDRKLTLDQKVEYADQASKLTGREVDLIDLRAATGTVLQEAVTRGVILKKTDPLILAAVLKRMWLDHEDFEKQRQRMLAERRKKVLGG